jgi:uncharacterized protein with FMN-binding domain
MKRGVVVAMSGLSVVVAGIGYRGSQRNLLAGVSAAAAPAGVVSASPAAVAPAAGPSGSPRGLATPVPSRRAAPPTRTAPPARATASPAAKAPTTTRVNGAPADTQYGPVQVQISIRGRRIIRADAIDYPQSGGRDREINSYAIPQLNQETLRAQSANIDSVSGATYTTDGYRQSLQSALDAAHRAGAW